MKSFARSGPRFTRRECITISSRRLSMRQEREIKAFFQEQEKELNKLVIQATDYSSHLNNGKTFIYIQILRFAHRIAGEIANSYR